MPLDVNTIRQMIRNESPARLEVGKVTTSDMRGTRLVSVRLSGGSVCTRANSCVDGLEVGDDVIVAHMEARDRVMVIAKIKNPYESDLSRSAMICPPDNLTVTGVPGAIHVQWDTYPALDVCWEVEYNTAAQESGATDAIVTKGSYYLYPVVDADADTGAPVTRYFRVRAVRWLGDNNVMYSGWSDWTAGTSVTWDGRYYTEDELSSTDCDGDHGASLIWICDADGHFTSNPSLPAGTTTVEDALEQLAESIAASGAPTDAQYVVMAVNGDLTAERVLTAGAGITLTDGGANGNATLAVDLTHAFTWAAQHTFNAGIVVGTGQSVTPADATGQDLGDATHRWTAWLDKAHFAGANGENEISVPDNVADALHIVDTGGTEYLRIVSTDADHYLAIYTQFGDTIRFGVPSVGGGEPNYAFQVRGDRAERTYYDIQNANAGGIAGATVTNDQGALSIQVLGSTEGSAWQNWGRIRTDTDLAGLCLMTGGAGDNIVLAPNNTEEMSITEDGVIVVTALSINTGAAPTRALEVNGEASTIYLYSYGDADTAIAFDVPDAIEFIAGNETLLGIVEAAQDYVKLGDGGDVDINLNDMAFLEGSSGNFAVGHTGPGFRLDVQADTAGSYAARIHNDGNNVNRHVLSLWGGADDGSGQTYYISCKDGDGGLVGYIWNNNTTFELVDHSDARIKTNIRDTGIDGLSIVKQIPVRDYEPAATPAGPTRCGFIGQELRAVYPEAAPMGLEEGDDHVYVSRMALIPVLVKAVQQLAAQVAALQSEL